MFVIPGGHKTFLHRARIKFTQLMLNYRILIIIHRRHYMRNYMTSEIKRIKVWKKSVMNCPPARTRSIRARAYLCRRSFHTKPNEFSFVSGHRCGWIEIITNNFENFLRGEIAQYSSIRQCADRLVCVKSCEVGIGIAADRRKFRA